MIGAALAVRLKRHQEVAIARFTLKPIAKQVIVITGATSGIGLATTRLLAHKGASLFLIARNESALSSLRDKLRAGGARVEFAVADVADPAAVEAAAVEAVGRFGHIDTWINDAGAFMYGRFDEAPLEDQRRLFDVTYWGVVHGTLTAARHLPQTGGAIVNVGSVLGEVAIPYQGVYCAAKFAVKGFTEAFRREAIAKRQKISITLIKPAAINTPFTDHARNRMGSPGTRNPPPAYDPLLVARAIAYACETPVRDLSVGGLGGISMVIANRLSPRAMDAVSALVGRTSMTTNQVNAEGARDNLYEPRDDLSLNSSLHPMTRRTSLALEAQLNPGRTRTVLAAGAAVLYVARRLRRRRAAA